MRALVVFESSFGNTGQVAQAVWEGMYRRLQDVALVDVASAPRRLPPDLELLVVGAPTHAFGMSRPSTPRAPYRAPVRRQPAATSRSRTVAMSRSAVIDTTASIIASSRSSRSLPSGHMVGA